MKRVLIIDDEPEVADVMRLFLDRLGYAVEVFLSCEDCLEALRGKEYWAVFCDYMMPKLTGDKLYRRLAEENRELAKRFVIITGAVLDERLSDFLSRERVRVVKKPFKLDEIESILLDFERTEGA